MEYDFAGWVTKRDIRCSDGVTIKQNAFENDSGKSVPLVWSHKTDNPENILGHVKLENRDLGVYGYGFFNETDRAAHAKQSLKHGDFSAMSIGARNIKKNGNDVIHGSIYEVSLVLAGANPGAVIEEIITHEATGDTDMIWYPGQLIHSSDDIIAHEDNNESEGSNMSNTNVEGETIEDVINTLNEKQALAVAFLLNAKETSMEQSAIDQEEGEDTMKQNLFAEQYTENTITHGELNDILHAAQEQKVDSFKDVLEHAAQEYGIRNIEALFPEATALTRTPEFWKDEATNYQKILSGTTKSPFQKVKTWFADLTEKEARARGYIKGNEKFEQVFEIFQRETAPQTIYKKQKLDRDDIIDAEGIDVVAYVNSEMRMMLEEEIARAILVGDGREITDPDKIKEDKIRPIIKEHPLYLIKNQITSDAEFFEDVINAMVEYRGSGAPTMYIDPFIIGRLKLLKGTDGRYLSSKPMTESEIASLIGVKEIVPTTFMLGKGALIVNLKDYTIGSAKGGQITRFEDFDIDFNQYKYLIETRLSGALTRPKSAIWLEEVDSTSPTTLIEGLKQHFKPGNKGLANDPLEPTAPEEPTTGE